VQHGKQSGDMSASCANPYSIVNPYSIALDLDECTGQWGPASFTYNAFRKFSAGGIPPPTLFVEQYLSKGGARPYLRELLQQLAKWKAAGAVKEVLIFTSATNQKGWVDFLQRCMEQYAGTNGLFGRKFVREDSPVAAGGRRTSKDLSRVSADPSRVLLIDDQPQNASHGLVLAVPQYLQHVDTSRLKQAIISMIPHQAVQIERAFEIDKLSNPPDLNDYSKDNALQLAIGQIAALMTTGSKPPHAIVSAAPAAELESPTEAHIQLLLSQPSPDRCRDFDMIYGESAAQTVLMQHHQSVSNSHQSAVLQVMHFAQSESESVGLLDAVVDGGVQHGMFAATSMQQGLSAGMDGSIDGCWGPRDVAPARYATIEANQVLWPSGLRAMIEIAKNPHGYYCSMVVNGQLYDGELLGSSIVWCDGNVWVKAAKAA